MANVSNLPSHGRRRAKSINSRHNLTKLQMRHAACDDSVWEEQALWPMRRLLEAHFWCFFSRLLYCVEAQNLAFSISTSTATVGAFGSCRDLSAALEETSLRLGHETVPHYDDLQASIPMTAMHNATCW